MTTPAPGPRDVWGPPGQARPQQPPPPQSPPQPYIPPPAGYQGQPVDPWLATGAWPDPYNQPPPGFGPAQGFGPPPGFGPAQGFPPPPGAHQVPPPKPPKQPREPMQPAALRLAVSAALIIALLAATLAAGLTAVYERHHPVAGTVATVTLEQNGPAQPGSPVPGSIAGIAAAVLPSVVTIQERSATVQGTGSGVVIDGAKGLILTNDHVVADAKADATGAVQVIPAGGTPADALPATIVGVDPTTDLAVVHVGSSSLKTATLGRSSALRVGDSVVAIGAPLGLAGTVTSGIVSYLGRNVPVPSETGSGAGNELVGAIQTDAAINPGNSGGALVDSLGRVIGINSAIASTGSGSATSDAQSGNIGVGFAIPIDEATQIAAQLIVAPHTATHPFLGVRTQDNMSPAGAKVSGVSDGTTTLPAVTPGSPAAKGGLRQGDVITAIDGDKVGGADDLLAAIRRHQVGETITVSFSRGGVAETTKVALANTRS